MTRFIRCCRIGGRAAETRRCAPGTAIAAALAVSLAALAIGGASLLAPTGAAFAQTPGTAGPVSFLFTGDAVDLDGDAAQKLADAARKAQAPGECPLGRLTFYSSDRDPLWQKSLAAARRQAVLLYLNTQGIDVSRFFADAPFVDGSKRDDVELDLNVARDDIAPTLDVQWTPPKGTKVKARDRITAKAVARDDANRWQSGIKTIDLDVQGGGQFGFGDYPQPPQTCENPPPPRTLEGVYTVPDNPPPIVRLRAIAEDFANHHDTDVGEFPTGDWYGTFGWKHICQGGGNRDETRGVSDLTLDHVGGGNLTGTLAGSTPERTQTMPTCSFRYVAPGTFSAKLVGSYTPGQDTFSAQAEEGSAQMTPGRASWTCPAGGGDVMDQGFYEVHRTQMLRNAFRDLRRQPDGSWKLDPDGKQTISAGGGTCTTTYSLTLRQARN